MSRPRPVCERVEEFRRKKKGNQARITYDEFGEIFDMFGVAAQLCDPFQIINTAFYLGYIKGERSRKGGGAA